MDDVLDEVASGIYVSDVSNCKDCGREIGFKDKKPYDAKYVTDGVYRLLGTRHWDTCPVRIKARIEGNCAWCQLEKGQTIAQVHRLIGYEKCERHSDKNEDVQYRGRTLKRNNDALKLMYHDFITEQRRLKRKSLRPENTPGIEVFIS